MGLSGGIPHPAPRLRRPPADYQLAGDPRTQPPATAGRVTHFVCKGGSDEALYVLGIAASPSASTRSMCRVTDTFADY